MFLLTQGLPEWMTCIFVVSLTTLLSISGFFLARKIFPAEISDDSKHVALAVLSVVATVNALLVAFAAISVWESHNAADQSVADEASTASELARDLAVYDTEASMKARQLLRAYVDDVIRQEWPALAVGEAAEHAWEEMDATFRAIAALDPVTPRQMVFLPEIFQRANELVKHRRARVFASQAEVPAMLWAVTIMSTLISLFVMYVLPFDRFHAALVGSYATSMGLVFFFIIVMDHPFAGREGISAAAFQMTLAGMDRWDNETAISPLNRSSNRQSHSPE